MNLRVKPAFIFIHQFLRYSPALILIMVIIFSGRKGGTLQFSYEMVGGGVGIFLIGLILRYLFYRCVTFFIEEGKVVYSNEFIIRCVREVKKENIKEIHFYQNFLQRIFGVGTIYLLTHATPFVSRRSSGIKMFDVADPQGVYNKIQQYINQK